jgi:hypothetical protein
MHSGKAGGVFCNAYVLLRMGRGIIGSVLYLNDGG